MAQQFCFEIYWPLIFKPISYLFGIYMACFYLSRNYWSLLDNDLTASIWEKAISILARNLNSGRSYLITAVLPTRIEKYNAGPVNVMQFFACKINYENKVCSKVIY